MSDSSRVIASGNLSTAHRTITGALALMEALEMSRSHAQEIIQNAGLPTHAYDDPSFPISANQHLELTHSALSEQSWSEPAVSRVLLLASQLTIDSLGVVGLVIKYSENFQEALRVSMAYPELSWGHSRILVTQDASAFHITFTMEQPKLAGISPDELNQLKHCCLILDVMASAITFTSSAGEAYAPTKIRFPFSAPENWSAIEQHMPYPIEFDAESAEVFFPLSIQHAIPIHANSLSRRSYEAMAQKLALMLSEGINHTEKVSRWLWAYTPPLSRSEIAKQLNMSERSLARKLKSEGTSYKALYNHVQTERAKNLLRNEALSIATIADRLGYSEQAVFSRAFTAQTQLAPLKWRTLNR